MYPQVQSNIRSLNNFLRTSRTNQVTDHIQIAFFSGDFHISGKIKTTTMRFVSKVFERHEEKMSIKMNL